VNTFLEAISFPNKALGLLGSPDIYHVECFDINLQLVRHGFADHGVLHCDLCCVNYLSLESIHVVIHSLVFRAFYIL